MGKAVVKLGDIPLAGTSAITWRFQTGTQPYSTVMSVHRDQWPYLRFRMGREVDLKITDQRGVEAHIRRLTILHEVASDSPYRVSFVVADRRWKWPYKLVIRDYNVTKRSGDTTSVGDLPWPGTVTVDQYDYRDYSLNNGNRWIPQDCVKDILDIVTEGNYEIESFPFGNDIRSSLGSISIQNVMLRDSGDVALGRLLSYIPGAEVYIDADGIARIFNAADLNAAKSLMDGLPPSTYDGDKPTLIDRRMIRPKKVIVHYQREVEALFDYQDDFGPTTTSPNPDALYVENVIPTVEPLTDLSEFDPVTGSFTDRQVGAGTYVESKAWLAKMDEIRTHESFQWNFDSISIGWVPGTLERHLGATSDGVSAGSEEINAALRVEALKANFRQTFRINRRYAERLRDLLPYRVAVLDTVTGARAPAAVWAEACLLLNNKGMQVNKRADPELANLVQNIFIPNVEAGDTIADQPPSPALVEVVDPDLGIYRLDWIASPYGTMGQIIPSNCVDESGSIGTVLRDLSQQVKKAMGFGIRATGRANGLLLRDRWRHLALMTIVPAAPNNKWQCHRVHVSADDIHLAYRGEYRITGGEGPELEVFAPPSEMTARYQWRDDTLAAETMVKLLGLDTSDPNAAGIQEDDLENNNVVDLPGFRLVNSERELMEHARAIAAEAYVNFVDSWQGRYASTMPEDIRLAGNILGVTIQVGSYPGAKVEAYHDFPGQQRPVSRLALMPQSVRELVLGILPFGGKRS